MYRRQMADGTMTGAAVGKVVKAVIRPLLEDHGFTKFTERKAWRSGTATVDVVDVRSFTRYIADGVGCTSYSFSVSLGCHYLCTGSDLARPQYYQTTFRAGLGKGLRQPFFRPYGGDRVTDRADVWFVLADGSNLVECVDDARSQLATSGLTLLDRWREPENAFHDLLNQRSTDVGFNAPGIRMPGAPDSPRWRDTTLAIGHLVTDDPRALMRTAPVFTQ